MSFADRLTLHPSTSTFARMRRCMWGQKRLSPVCPEGPRLDGRVALVTGGTRGIGLETSRGLAVRGGEVIAASRGAEAGKRAAEALRAETDVPCHHVPLDLADLARIPQALDALETVLAGRPLEVLVANAGLWPTRYAESAQGHEIAFATNVLGHHALIQGALGRDLLAEGARVVLVTGDIYILSRDCTPDYRYRGPLGGQLAYCRSKLGNLWMARELARRPLARRLGLRVHAVHPGVIASELGGPNTGLAGAAKRALMLSVPRGAQTTLFCATQPDLESGTYWHNTLGRMELAPSDPGADDAKAAALWQRLEALQ